MIESSALLLTAKRYAQLFGVSLRVQGSTAYTNGKVITIPRFDYTNEYKSRLAYGFIAHEAGHIKHTDFEILKRPAVKNSGFLFALFNILEDCRIEQLMSKMYIGVAENLELLNSYYKHEEQELMSKLDKVPIFNVYAIYVQCYGWVHWQKYDRRLELAMAENFLLSHNQETTLKLRDKLQEFYKKEHTCEETYRMALAIAKLLRDNLTDKDMTKGDDDIRSRHDDSQLETPADHKNKLQGTASLACGYDREAQLSDTPIGAVARMLASNGGSSALEAVSSGKTTSSREDFGVFADVTADEGRADFGDTIKASYGVVNALRNYIRAKTTSLKELSEQGRRLNVKRLVRAPCGETRVFLNRTLELEHNTNVQLLVDASSSMLTSDNSDSSRIEDANKVALILAKALDKLENVDRAVYYFPGTCSETAVALRKDEPLGQIQMARFDQKPRGSTPLAQAMWQAFENMKFTDKERNVLLVITDGMPDSVSNVKDCFEFAEKHNIEVYGISIRSEMILRLFKKCVVIENAQQLQDKATHIIKSLFNYDNLIKQLI